LVAENLSFYEIRKTIAEIMGEKAPTIPLPHTGFLALSYILNLIYYLTEKRPKFTPENARLNQIFLYFSNEKAKRELGMEFRPFKGSVERMIGWYKENKYL
jgi:nucleoside-diphosphate-sugar epimerase